MRSNHFIGIGFFLAIILGWALLYHPNPHPSDAALIVFLQKHRVNFDRLVSMATEDSKVRTIYTDQVMLEDYKIWPINTEEGFTPQRWNAYQSLFAIAQEEFVCGNEAQTARAQAVRLQNAAALCRQDLMNDSPDCSVNVARWHVKLTASEAETLAAQLLQYANEMEALDKQLEERMSHYTVSSSQSTVSAVDLRCSNVAVTVGGDRVTECLMCCYRRFGIPALDALRGNVETMLPLFAANFGNLKGCEHLCVTTASSCGEFPNKATKDWSNPNTPSPSPPTPSKPECVSCPSGYHCNQAKDGCDADEPKPKPKPKPGTEHHA